MHLADSISVLEDSDPEWLHNIIVCVFDMVLEGAPVIPSHVLSRLEPQLLLMVGTMLRSSEHIYQYVDSVHLGPSP